jgi:hypothetical protein
MIMSTSTSYTYTFGPLSDPTWSVSAAATVVTWDILFMLNIIEAPCTLRHMVSIIISMDVVMMVFILERFPKLCPCQSTCRSCSCGEDQGQSEEFHLEFRCEVFKVRKVRFVT